MYICNTYNATRDYMYKASHSIVLHVLVRAKSLKQLFRVWIVYIYIYTHTQFF